MNRNALLAIVLALLIIMSGVQVNTGTQAAFSDVATINGNTFATGSIDIALASNVADCDPGSGYTDAASAILTSSGIRPGDVVTASVCIKNTSTTLDTRWSLTTPTLNDTTTTTTTLRSNTYIKMWTLDAAASAGNVGCINGFTAAGAEVTLSGNQPGLANTVLISQSLGTQPTIAASASTLITNTASNHQKLCVSVVLPSSIADSDPADGNSLQGKTINMDFQVTGNQLP